MSIDAEPNDVDALLALVSQLTGELAELHLIAIKPFGPPAKLGALQQTQLLEFNPDLFLIGCPPPFAGATTSEWNAFLCGVSS